MNFAPATSNHIRGFLAGEWKSCSVGWKDAVKASLDERYESGRQIVRNLISGL